MLGKRILVVGQPGAGKTHFSRLLAKQFSLPMFRLDDLYWQPQWIPMKPSDWEHKINQILDGEQWIIDGNYLDSFKRRLEKADHVILLDYSSMFCTHNFCWRGLKRVFGDKSNVPAQVLGFGKATRKFLFPWKNVKLVLKFTFFFKLHSRRFILKEAKRYHVPVMRFRSRNEARQYLKAIGSSHNEMHQEALATD